MTGPNRDCDKEMAAIDKSIAKQPAAPAGKPVPAGTGSSAPAARAALPPPVRSRRTVLTAWIRVILGVAVAVGVTQWPYDHGCGMLLYAYLAAVGGVILAGLWGAATAWSRRMGLAHVVSLLVTIWGAGLAAKAVLDRSSYVRHPAVWVCK